MADAENGLVNEELQAAMLNPATQVMFRAGLLACREYMAAFVEQGGNKDIADSIRANWWPSLGEDPGVPRKNTWQELTEGEYGEPGFRVKTADEISPSLEALPVALIFLQGHCGWPHVHHSPEKTKSGPACFRDSFLEPALKRISHLMAADPADDTDAGKELSLLAQLAELYEKQKYPAFATKTNSAPSAAGGRPAEPSSPRPAEGSEPAVSSAAMAATSTR